MNGAAAHLITAGEQIIVMGFELTGEIIQPSVILVDEQNRFVRDLVETPGATTEGGGNSSLFRHA